MENQQLTEDELNQIYNWIDEIPLSRPKKNIARDFADGVLVAEVIAHFIPKIVEIHNYSPANGRTQRLYNWNTMNQKVLKKLNFQLTKQDIENVISCQPEAIEKVLRVIQIRLEKYFEKSKMDADADNSPLKPSQKYGQQQQQYQENVNSNAPQYNPKMMNSGSSNDPEAIIQQRDGTIQELKETVEILELKIKKLEQLIKLKDSKIQTLQNKLSQNGIN
jgi:hypothetical protein